VIVAAAFLVALANPPQQALIDRWVRGDRTHTFARLASVSKGARSVKAVTPDLDKIAAREFSIEGRYRLASPAVSSSEPWWGRLWQWVHDRWAQFWQRLFGRVHVGQQEAASIGDVVLVVLGLILVFVIVRLLMNLQLARDAPAAAVPLEGPPSARALYKQACFAASGGDYGTAALLLFAATVALLERRGDFGSANSSTVGDLRRTLRRRNAKLVAPFDAVAAPFVQRAYAERDVDESQWQHAREAFERLLSPRSATVEG
jgi:hypothetical protein